MNKLYTSAIIGCGSRGWVYGTNMEKLSDKFKIVAACDIDKTALLNAKSAWRLGDEDLFEDETEFLKKKRADVLVIATQDRDHVRMCIRAMELGYDILMEKPISPSKEEIDHLLEANKKYKSKIVICHVLRYAPAYLKIKELLDAGEIGELIHIENIEQVGYWHQAHSFVRGNWRDENTTSPMIMQKCCHDFDMLAYFANSKCDTLYSVGRRSYFKAESKPAGASERCSDCKYKTDCPYSAERIYIERWKKKGSPEFDWPYNVVCNEIPNTETNIRAAYEAGQYGRCVFACDNNVVDNQQVIMTFENGITVSHTMSAFTDKTGRRMTLHGTLGEIMLTEDKKTITVSRFGKEDEVISILDLVKELDGMGHGGGDTRLINALYDIIENGTEASTTLEKSVESHLMAFAAEKSRRTGNIVKVHD